MISQKCDSIALTYPFQNYPYWKFECLLESRYFSTIIQFIIIKPVLKLLINLFCKRLRKKTIAAHLQAKQGKPMISQEFILQVGHLVTWGVLSLKTRHEQMVQKVHVLNLFCKEESKSHLQKKVATCHVFFFFTVVIGVSIELLAFVSLINSPRELAIYLVAP
jgi:hypothetical protein